MNKAFLYATAVAMGLSGMQHSSAQNTPPYWSLAGNNNATPSSKLGTTNNISLRFYTNNQQRMIINSEQGWVGIGTSAPTERLHVNSVAGANAFRVQVNGSTKLLVHSNGGVSVGSFSPAPANGLYVSGNVGIGTNTPTNKLHVVGRGAYTTALRVANGGVVVDIPWSTGDTSIGIYSGAGTGVFGEGMIGIKGDGMVGVQGSGYTGVSGYSGEGGGNGVEGYGMDGTGVYGNSNSGFGGNFESESSWGLRASTTSGFYAGMFYGNVFTTGGYYPSDKNFKQNIQEFKGAMGIINKLKPRHYEYKRDGQYAFLNLARGSHYGLLAQDVEEVLPNLVATSAHAVPKTGSRESLQQRSVNTPPANDSRQSIDLKAVNYTELIPIMIKGMQEQSALIEEQQQQINELKDQIARLKSGGITTVTGVGALGLASPNPVRNTTRISYQLPSADSRAQLLLTDAGGKTVKAVSLNNSGYVNLDVTGLSSGIYNYSLLVDGKIVASRKIEVARNR